MRYKLPGYSAVGGSIEFDVRGTEVRRNSRSGEKYRSSLPLREVAGQEVEEGLISVAISVLGVVHPGDLAP